MADYVKWIRGCVGHEPIFLNAAGAIVVNENGEILLQRRGDFSMESWGLPAGAMEIGETPEATMQREVLEETGLTVEVERYLGTYVSDGVVVYENGDQCQIILFVFVCRVKSGALTVDGKETVALEFFHPEKRPTLFRSHLERAISDFLAGKSGVLA